MTASSATNVPILVVEQDESLRDTFAELLAEGGYMATFAASLAVALEQIDRRTYALVLADLFAGRSPYEFSEAHRLRRFASPTPVGLLTTQAISSQDAQHAGFAFGLSMPFDIDVLLGCIASTLDHPFSSQEHEQVQIIQRYFAALEAGNWMTLLSLCTDDVSFYPPRGSLVTASRRLRGKSDFLAYSRASVQQYKDVAFTDLRLYPCPKGISVRYASAWVSPDDYWHHAAETTHFHFQGLLIHQVGVRVNLTANVGVTRTAG